MNGRLFVWRRRRTDNDPHAEPPTTLITEPDRNGFHTPGAPEVLAAALSRLLSGIDWSRVSTGQRELLLLRGRFLAGALQDAGLLVDPTVARILKGARTWYRANKHRPVAELTPELRALAVAVDERMAAILDPVDRPGPRIKHTA